MARIALIPGTFDPPTLEDAKGISAVINLRPSIDAPPIFDEVVLCVMGDEVHPSSVSSLGDRLAMIRLGIHAHEHLFMDVEFSDRSIEASAYELKMRHATTRNEVAYVVRFEDILRDEAGLTRIERYWQNGVVVQIQTPFYVRPLHGVYREERLLPPRATYLPHSASYGLNEQDDVRSRLARDEDVEPLLAKPVIEFIRKNGLYRVK